MAEIALGSLKQRIKALKREIKDIYERRRFYGETGFRCSKLTDDLLQEAKQKEIMLKKLEALVRQVES